MKMFFLMLFCLLCLSYQSKKVNKTTSQNGVDSIKLFLVKIEMQRPVSLACDSFFNWEKNNIDTFVLTAHADKVLKYISFPRRFSSHDDGHGIDTKAKMFIWYHSGVIDTVCLGYLPAISINHNYFRMDTGKGG